MWEVAKGALVLLPDAAAVEESSSSFVTMRPLLVSDNQSLLIKNVKLRFLHSLDVDEVLLFFCMLFAIQPNKALHPSVFDVVEVLPITSKKVSLLPLPFQPLPMTVRRGYAADTSAKHIVLTPTR